jgi:hypothetical protein
MTTLTKRCAACGWPGAKLGFQCSSEKGFFGRCVGCGFTAPPSTTQAGAIANWEAATDADDQQGTVTMPLW